MKIVVVGLGYVGAVERGSTCAHNNVIGVDISQERVDALNARKSPILMQICPSTWLRRI